MRRIRVVSRASSRPFGGGMTFFCCYGAAIPLNPPFQGGPQGLPPSGHPQSKTSQQVTVVEANRFKLAGERPFLGSPGGYACGAFT